MSPHLAAVAEGWRQAEQRQYSACNHCDHHTWAERELRCGCPALAYAGQARPVALVRRPHGGCGPEAVHMSAPWLKH